MYQSNVDLGLQTGSLKTFLFKKYGIVTKALFLHVCICNFFLHLYESFNTCTFQCRCK